MLGRCCSRAKYHATLNVNTKIKNLPLHLHSFSSSSCSAFWSSGKGSGGETETNENDVSGATSARTTASTRRDNRESKTRSNGNDGNGNTNRGLLLALSPTLWMEPDASAAGVRTASLLDHFANGDNNSDCSSNGQSPSLFNGVHYGCGLKMETSTSGTFSKGSPDAITNTNHRIPKHHIPPNRSDTIKSFLQSEEMRYLDVAMFDRFFAEEVYSFHLYNNRPNALRILDMQDMHSLRHHRQCIVEEYQKEVIDKLKDNDSNNRSSSSSMLHSQLRLQFSLSNDIMKRVMSSYPTLDTKESNDNSRSSKKSSTSKSNSTSTLLLRELASIHRSDLTLVCSPYELALLRDEYGVPPNKLTLAPFFIDSVNDIYFSSSSSLSPSTSTSSQDDFSFNGRNDFVTLGGFKHPPNVDQVKVLKYDIWPKIRNELPFANLRIYGSYLPQSISQLHDEKSGFFVEGYVKPNDLAQVLGSCKVMLSPLRFGAGIKGKVVDSWKYGCPVVTTPIGAEGLLSSLSSSSVNNNGFDSDDCWGGVIASNTTDFVRGAVDLYSNRDRWESCQGNGRTLLKSLFDAESKFRSLDHDLRIAMDERHERRQKDYFSASLWHQQSRSTEYFSRWIELKETNNVTPSAAK